jgi:putative acetyltransferase
MNYLVRQEKSEDYDKVRGVLQSAFFRDGKDAVFNEWILVEKIRDSEYYIPELSLVAEADGQVVGYILFSPMKIRGANTSFDSLALAPLAVYKDYQKQGIGKHLVRLGIERAKKLGFKSMVVLGHPDYYSKFGFKRASKWRIGTTEDFNDECLFVLELVKDGLRGISGVVQYCPLFYGENGELI